MSDDEEERERVCEECNGAFYKIVHPNYAVCLICYRSMRAEHRYDVAKDERGHRGIRPRRTRSDPPRS